MADTTITGTTFTRMDESTAEQWAVIGAETFKHQDRVAERVLGLLRSLSDIVDGFATDQLTHCLQTATLGRCQSAPGAIEPRRLHPHPDLARTGLRSRHVTELQDFGAAGDVNAHRFHRTGTNRRS